MKGRKSVGLPLVEATEEANGAICLLLRGELACHEKGGNRLLYFTPAQAEQVYKVLGGILGKAPKLSPRIPLFQRK